MCIGRLATDKESKVFRANFGIVRAKPFQHALFRFVEPVRTTRLAMVFNPNSELSPAGNQSTILGSTGFLPGEGAQL